MHTYLYDFDCICYGIFWYTLVYKNRRSTYNLNDTIYDYEMFNAIGIGYTQLSELSSSAELPFLSSTAYLKYLSIVSDAIKDTAIDEMLKAGNEERQLAIKSGNIDEDGIPMCTVIADGQWSKRSYKMKFNAFSGAVRMLF